MKILIVAHGHPDYSAGGAEMAAYSLYRALSDENPDDVCFLSWISSERMKLHSPNEVTRLGPGRNEWLLHAPNSEWLYQSTVSRSLISRSFIRFMQKINPDVIHFHHYLGIGLDAIRLVRRLFPNCRIVVTLHEFLAICLRDGQMITRPANKLCVRASSLRCSGCFPELYRSHFGLRELWYKRHFAMVDGFISPSQFLKQRYVAWGIQPERIEVIENAQVCTEHPEQRRDPQSNAIVSTFGFFGQLNPYKGIDILLKAAVSISAKLAANPSAVLPRIVVYGTMAGQSDEFKDRMTTAFSKAPEILEYRGPYDMSEVISLMSSVGWVVVPSIWWENSPVVIEEAFFSGRPVICSDIGGMAEKVTHGLNGLQFRARDPDDLARVILEASSNEVQWRDMTRNVRPVPGLAETGTIHGEYYDRLAPRRVSEREALH
ncbi:MAG: glycosyltransferase family 4 protein [Pseudomonadota bacterium]|nr:glycosyltransferase family 4 protein [Pseudomonadota bacterium]